MSTVIRRYSAKDGHPLKKPYKTSLWRFLHNNRIGDTPRIKRDKK